MKIIYPGSFDPVTLGHLDIIRRSAKLFDEVVVGVLENGSKTSLFTRDEKIEMLEELLYDYDNVSVKSFSGLLVDFVRLERADGVVRGLRAVTDYEYEQQMATLNRALYEPLETIFLVADGRYDYVSSSFAREIARYGGDVSKLVPECVAVRLSNKFNGGK